VPSPGLPAENVGQAESDGALMVVAARPTRQWKDDQVQGAVSIQKLALIASYWIADV